MTILGDFKNASVLCKLAFVWLLLASMLTCISYTTTSWGYNEIGTKMHWGLWRLCGQDEIPTGCQSLDGWSNDWYGVVQTFVTIGFFGTLVTFFLIIMYMFVGKCQKNGEVGLAAGIIAIVTGIFYLVGCIVFGVQWDEHWTDNATAEYRFGYSFAVSIVAIFLELIGGVLILLDSRGCGKGAGDGQTRA